MSDSFVQNPRVLIGQMLEQALGLHRQNKLAEAEKIYKRLLKTFPGQFDALHLLGMLNYQRGRAGEALSLIDAALKVQPKSADALSNRGLVLRALRRDADALASFEQAIALDPGNVQAINNRGNALLEAGRGSEALAAFDAVLALQPGYVEARIGRNNALLKIGRIDEAIAGYDKVAADAPAMPGLHFNRGNALFARNDLQGALAAYERALALDPNSGKAWNARGVMLQALKRNPEAVACFEKALALDGGDADAHFNLSLSLLSLGDYPRGFREYEWRWTRTGMPGHRNLRKPLWNGDYPLERKTILLHAEQGLGDTIQFARYVPMLTQTGARVVMEVQPELKSLLSNLDGAPEVIARGEPLPAFDVHCPLGNLPLAFKTAIADVPANIPYLKAPADRLPAWSARLSEIAAPRIALVWSGSAAHANDRNRSIALARLLPLLAASAAGFVSVQRDLRDEDIDILQHESRIAHVGAELTDFADTAAIVAQCDLVISVDTAVAHLAAAMGRPVWLLLAYAPDWRWTLDGASSPWYPQVKLFRQPRLGDWDSVVADVGRRLADMQAAR